MCRCQLSAHQRKNCQEQEPFHSNLRGTILSLCGWLKEAIVCVIVVFDLEAVAQIGKKTFERLILSRRHFQRGQHASEIGAVISVMEQRNIPSAAQRIEELKQRARPFGKFESAKALAFHITRVSSDHISDMQLREFVLG